MAKKRIICQVCGSVAPLRSNRCWSCGARVSGGRVPRFLLSVLGVLLGCVIFLVFSALTNGI